MTGLDTPVLHQWSLAPLCGFAHPLLIINGETVLYTWFAIGLLLISALLFRLVLKTHGRARFMALAIVSSLMDTTKQTLGTFSFNHFSFISTLFVFIALANTLAIIPWLDEPTNDINTTLALGLIAFMYTQHTSIKTIGIKKYIKGYFSPVFIMLPLNIIGKLSSVISLSFRLFGNIAGGGIIATMYFDKLVRSSVYTELLFMGAFSMIIAILFCIYKRSPLTTVLNCILFSLFFTPNMLITLFFGIFEGFLQAFVFTTLSLTYLATALQGDSH
jgi:F-type H+-transporting ATPase subunit a